MAAAKREISVVKGCDEHAPEVLDGISLGSSVDVMGAGSSALGFEGGLSMLEVLEGISFGSSVDVMGAGSSVFSGLGEAGGVGGAANFPGLLSSKARKKFSSPLLFGTKKLYAIGCGACGGASSSCSRISAELAICACVSPNA